MKFGKSFRFGQLLQNDGRRCIQKHDFFLSSLVRNVAFISDENKKKCNATIQIEMLLVVFGNTRQVHFH